MQSTTPSKNAAPPQKPAKPEVAGTKDQPKENVKKDPPQQQGGQNQQQHGHRNQQNQGRGRGRGNRGGRGGGQGGGQSRFGQQQGQGGQNQHQGSQQGYGGYSDQTFLPVQDGPKEKKKFTGRCRLFVGNITPDTTEEEFKDLFKPFGEINECFVNGSKGFGFIRLVCLSN